MNDSKTEGIVDIPHNLIMLEPTRLAEFARTEMLVIILLVDPILSKRDAEIRGLVAE
jgi:hypothetical protein